MIELSDNISEYISRHFGKEFFEKYLEYTESEYAPYLRISLMNENPGIIRERLLDYGIELMEVPEVRNAYKIINGVENIGKTLEFTLGRYYIQSLSSMIPPLVLAPNPEDKVLDLCAAPGSKTTQLAELMSNKGTLYANEISIERVKGLIFNIDKMSLVNLGVIRHKGELLSKTFENYFDKILVDAPCSALGIVQKKGEVSNWWNEKQVDKIAGVQLRLLISAIKMLKEGGEIVYSTCTMTLEENEMVVNTVLKNYPVELIEFDLPVKSHQGFAGFNEEEFHEDMFKTKRIIPWEISSEGFFIAKLRKTDSTPQMKKEKFRERGLKFLNASNNQMSNYLQNISDRFGIPPDVLKQYKYLIKSNDIFFIDKDWEAQSLDIFLRIGTKFGIIDKRNEAHLFTNSAKLLEDYISKNIVELENLDDLKVYFSGGIIKGDFPDPGQKVIKYNGMILGTAVAFKEGLKSQFPRPMRTHDIIFPER